MSNNFIKRSGSLADNSDLAMSEINIKILASQSPPVILAGLKSLMSVMGIISTAAKCLDFYISPFSRNHVKNHFGGGKLIGPSTKALTDIVKKNYHTAGMDYLVFNGYKFIDRGDLYKYTQKIKNTLISHVKYNVRNNTPVSTIKKLYNYETVPEVIRNKNNFSDNDFYYAVGDGNYLFGKVNSLNTQNKKFQILFVLHDQYNWDDNVTYFLKYDTKDGPYLAVVETAAFKKLENNGLASIFLQFFVDTCTVSYG